MELRFWQYDLLPTFAFDSVRYTVAEQEGALHWHNYYQLALCLQGSGRFLFAQKAYDYTAGDIFVVDNTEQHGAFVKTGQTAQFLFLMFYPQFVLHDTNDAFNAEYLLSFAYRSENFCNKISGETPLAQELGRMMLHIEDENKQRRRGCQHIIHANLCVVLAELTSHYGAAQAARNVMNQYRKLRPALVFIEQHCCEKITLEQVAQAVYISPSRFRHLFRETMHVGFKEYVIGLRFEHAKTRLISSDEPIESIAAECGFSNLNSFYKLFHLRENTTPADFRTQLFTTENKTAATL